jgi:hypothetical protein
MKRYSSLYTFTDEKMQESLHMVRVKRFRVYVRSTEDPVQESIWTLYGWQDTGVYVHYAEDKVREYMYIIQMITGCRRRLTVSWWCWCLGDGLSLLLGTWVWSFLYIKSITFVEIYFTTLTLYSTYSMFDIFNDSCPNDLLFRYLGKVIRVDSDTGLAGGTSMSLYK